MLRKMKASTTSSALVHEPSQIVTDSQNDFTLLLYSYSAPD